MNIKLKSSLFIALLALSFGAMSQTLVGNNVQIYNQLTLKGKKITDISADSTFSNPSDVAIPTQLAVYNFVTNRAASLDSVTRNGDSITFWKNGSVYIQFKDSSFNQPLLPAKSVPFIGTDGKLTYSSNLSWDGTNLTAGNGGFYSSSGLLLNGGRAFLGASGWGADFYAPTGGRNSDASKHIKFWNADRWYLDLSLPDNGSPQTDPLQGTAQMNWSPALNDSFNIGSASRRWKNGYFKNLYINGSLFNPDLAGSYVPLTDKASANGIATLDGTGKVPLSQLPAITTNKPTYVQHISDMLALSATQGDIAVVGDSSKSYALLQTPASTLSNWLELKSPIPSNTDLLPEGTSNKYYSDSRARNAISGTGRVTYNSTTGYIGVIAVDWDVPGDIMNKPIIPPEFNPSEGQHISIAGTYPNLTFDTKRIYDSTQIDSIATKLRSEIQIAANGGVTINQVDSAVSSQITAGNYQTKTMTDAAYKPITYVPAWNEITGKPTLFSGSYTDLTNKPTIPTVPSNVSAFTNDANYLKSADIAGKVNTSDTAAMLSKYVSTAVANATYAAISNVYTKSQSDANLALKANDNAVVHLTGGAMTGDLNVLANKKIYFGNSYVQQNSSGSFTFQSSKVAGNGNFTINTDSAQIFLNYIGGGSQVNFANGNAGIVAYVTKTGLANFSSTVTASSFIKSGSTSNQFLMGDGSTKPFGTTAGTVMDAQIIIDSLTAINARLQKKLDTSFKQSMGIHSPLIGTMYGDSIDFKIRQSYLDSLAYKVDVWPLAGSPVTNSVNKYLGYSVADSLIFKVKGQFAGMISATTLNAGLGNGGFLDGSGNIVRGNYNTWLGRIAGAGKNYSTGGIYIGENAHTTKDSSINVIVIGADAVATKDFQTVIGTSNTTETQLYGTIKTGSDTLVKKSDLKSYATLTDLKNVSGVLKNRDYANDSIAFMAGHLNQWDLYRTGNDVKVLTTVPIDQSMLNYVVDNSDGSANTYKILLKTYAASLNATVYWGDGDSTVLSGATTYEPRHTYASAIPYLVKVRLPTISDLREIYLNDSTNIIKVTGIYGINLLTNLNVFKAQFCSLTNSIVDTLSYPNVGTIDFGTNNLTGFNPTTMPVNLKTLVLRDNKISSSAILNLPATLTSLDFQTENPGEVRWNATDVNTMLQYIDSKTFNAGAKTLDIRQFNSATPTGAGLSAKTSLQGKGWIVTTD